MRLWLPSTFVAYEYSRLDQLRWQECESKLYTQLLGTWFSLSQIARNSMFRVILRRLIIAEDVCACASIYKRSWARRNRAIEDSSQIYYIIYNSRQYQRMPSYHGETGEQSWRFTRRLEFRTAQLQFPPGQVTRCVKAVSRLRHPRLVNRTNANIYIQAS